mmetsp:Transcript_11485/g.26243  ORF Transcript_11485/g.26243 Transcript_11485/m.26243 type:complete len:539 (+) Transcript_11485:74-1690(+)
MTIIRRRPEVKAPLVFLALAAFFLVVKDELLDPLLYQTLRGRTNYVQRQVYIPPSLDVDSQRSLSLNLGNGDCKWMPPNPNVPTDVDYQKTIVVGYPSGDKRMVYVQMEALTGISAKDEWDFAFQGASNHPFIKANYPHHEGVWGWGSVGDQVVLMVPNIRRSMIEYHDILWDLNFAETWGEANQMRDNLFASKPPVEDFYAWRDLRVMDEIHWYGWFIDYWMEGGLMRDIFTHQLTTSEHWNHLLASFAFTREELAMENYVDEDQVVSPSYDPHCVNDVSGGCVPVSVISADKLRDYDEGPAETAKVASVLKNDDRTGQYVIEAETWDCIWSELIEKKKGPKVIDDRPGYSGIIDIFFSHEMLYEMLGELDRLITKYSGPAWSDTPTAVSLVSILQEHYALIQIEKHEVLTGVRKLRSSDFLGSNERERRKAVEMPGTSDEKKDLSKFFVALEQQRMDLKHKRVAEAMAQRETDAIDKEEPDAADGDDTDSVEALTNVVSQIKTLEDEGGTDEETAAAMLEKIRDITARAKVVLADE